MCIGFHLASFMRHRICVKESESCSVVSDSWQPHRLCSPWNSPGQNAGVGSLSLLQEIFPTQRSNPDLPHCRQILYQLSHQRSPVCSCKKWKKCLPVVQRSSHSTASTKICHNSSPCFSFYGCLMFHEVLCT